MADKKEKVIPRGPAATAAKNKYRDNNYDRAELALPKGMKVDIKKLIDSGAVEEKSTNAYITEAIKEKYKRDTGEEWKCEQE
jgi:hypothetical protein